MTKFVGCCTLEVSDKEDEITFPLLVMYPTNTAAQTVAFGPFSLEVALNAPVAKGRFSLAAISPGSGGSNLTHRTLGLHLAQNGFIAGMLDHSQFTHKVVANVGHYSFLSPFRNP